MGIRLVLAVLVLVGQMPFRYCTCAATDAHPIDRHCCVANGCECDSDAGDAESRQLSQTDEMATTIGHHPSDNGPHQPDCPVVNPQARRPVALPASVPVADSDPAPINPLTPFSVAALTPNLPAPIHHSLYALAIPRFLFLLVLRN